MKALFIVSIIVCVSPWTALSIIGSVYYHKPMLQCFMSHRMDCE